MKTTSSPCTRGAQQRRRLAGATKLAGDKSYKLAATAAAVTIVGHKRQGG